MVKICKHCGRLISDDCSVCPLCHKVIEEEPTVVDISKVTTISGETYEISGSTVSSPSFYSIADKFEDESDEGKPKERLRREELKSDIIDDEKIDLYKNWGFLKQNPDETWSLTEYGKKAYKINRKKKKKFMEELE